MIDDEAGERRADTPKSPYRGARRTLDGRACPFCGAGLELVTVPELGVQVDVCREHGTWFDVTELRAVVDHYVEKRSRRDDVVAMLLDRAREPSRRARGWHPFW